MKITATILLNEYSYAFDISTTLFSDRRQKPEAHRNGWPMAWSYGNAIF
jgi:hypothetical protein